MWIWERQTENHILLGRQNDLELWEKRNWAARRDILGHPAGSSPVRTFPRLFRRLSGFRGAAAPAHDAVDGFAGSQALGRSNWHHHPCSVNSALALAANFGL